MISSIRWALPVALIAMTGLNTAPVDAADANYFKGKTMTITIGYGFGGSYGMYSRTFAQHLGKHIPGKPTVVVPSTRTDAWLDRHTR